MSSKDSSLLLVERQGPVGLITLNRPSRRNALSPLVLDAINRALDELADARAVVLTGAGPVFCAGGELAPPSDDGFLGGHRGRGGFATLLARMLKSPVPLIAAVNGDALGGGLGLVAACHLIVADERAHFGAPELRVGLFPMMIGPVLARKLPRNLLHDLILTGRRLSAAEGLAVGFVNRVSPPEEVVLTAMTLAGELAGWSPAVVGLGLSALAAVDDLPIEAALAYTHSQLSINLLLDDASEGISAFLARRQPEWKGR